ncbi:FadR/GntR family transcriptional regulator [Alkalihalobacillus sp. BA299]|uniref:FadR/GntR family transcriptional regulator n=1 Tax=Alkalihalobacillus sp. BA299 TaxID=2815938 RepID=UPI001AD9B2DC|nr:FadR/GntR family transcriptional regulator [Alkalihalobacillus sp. BA299]
MSNNKGPLSLEIAMRLQKMILSEEEYKPNDKIPDERTLAQILGVSRNSIREAIKILVGNGVLIVRRGVGTFVANNPNFISDPFRLSLIEDHRELQIKWYEVRLMLEPEAMRLVAERITHKEIEQLTVLEQECADLIKNGFDYTDADNNFHTFLAKATHNEIIERLIQGIGASVSSGVAEGKELARRNALENHRLIVEYIKQRDGTGAYNAMRLHLLQGKEDIMNQNN